MSGGCFCQNLPQRVNFELLHININIEYKYNTYLMPNFTRMMGEFLLYLLFYTLEKEKIGKNAGCAKNRQNADL
jgi:hypothetical protein